MVKRRRFKLVTFDNQGRRTKTRSFSTLKEAYRVRGGMNKDVGSRTGVYDSMYRITKVPAVVNRKRMGIKEALGRK